jgi:hypothetical protein
MPNYAYPRIPNRTKIINARFQGSRTGQEVERSFIFGKRLLKQQLNINIGSFGSIVSSLGLRNAPSSSSVMSTETYVEEVIAIRGGSLKGNRSWNPHATRACWNGALLIAMNHRQKVPFVSYCGFREFGAGDERDQLVGKLFFEHIRLLRVAQNDADLFE